jgi:hypothetical protein
MFWDSVFTTVKTVYCCIQTVYCCIQKSQSHHSVNCCQSLLTLSLIATRTVFFITFHPQDVICCSIHTVCCKHVLIRCPSRSLGGLIGPASVSWLNQEPLPARSCLLVWWVFLSSWEQHFIFCPRHLSYEMIHFGFNLLPLLVHPICIECCNDCSIQ